MDYSTQKALSQLLLLQLCLLGLAAAKDQQNLIPETFPEGVDPSQYALPVFLQEPQDTFAARGASAILSCKAAHALKAHFTCNDEEIEGTEEDLIENGVKLKKLSIEVSRSDLHLVLGKFTCRCHASSAQGEVVSSEAAVKSAYLRKDFDTPPYSQQIELGSQAQLRCHPPKGSPAARVIGWQKNGVDINDPNFIASTDGHLILIQARMEDAGNYTCLASNDVLTRSSPPAQLTVYVPGQWSNWAAWSDCSAKCGRGIRTRTRTCNNPAPINNGPGCEGPPVEKKTCSSVCPKVDGKWSSWSSWSSCSPDCQQFRRRDCNNPKPDNGGRYCQGKDIASQNCTGGMCKPGLHSIVLYGTEPPTEVSDNASGVPVDVSLWIGLLVALVVFILAFLFIVKMMLRKKRLPASGYTLTTSGEGGNPGSRMSKSGSTLGYAPDLTSGVQNEYNFTYSDKNSNSSIKSNSHGINGMSTPIPMAPFTEFRPISEHLYEQPMVPMQKASPDSHERAPFLPLDNASSASEQMTISAPSPSTSTTFSNSFSMPRNISAQHMNWATVTETGTRITVPKSTVTLTIPQGAVAPGRTQDIYVAVVAADRLKPRNQTLITPVVQWGGPIARNLLKPVVLSVPHVSKDNRRVMRALYCPDLEMDNAEWTVLNVDNNMQVDPSYVHLVTDKVGAYVMISENQHEIMSKTTKTALCRCLDVPTCQGNDWRKLAEVLGLNHYSMHFANQPSPSEAILNLWEARNNANDTKVALLKLEQLLKDINRLDAVVILQRELK